MAQLYELSDYKFKKLELQEDYFDLTPISKIFGSNLNFKISYNLLITLMNIEEGDNTFLENLFEIIKFSINQVDGSIDSFKFNYTISKSKVISIKVKVEYLDNQLLIF